MKIPIRAIEATGRVDEKGELHLDEPLALPEAGPVRVIVLLPEDEDADESEWLTAAASNPAFDFLKDAAEEIYTVADGKPFQDEG